MALYGHCGFVKKCGLDAYVGQPSNFQIKLKHSRQLTARPNMPFAHLDYVALQEGTGAAFCGHSGCGAAAAGHGPRPAPSGPTHPEAAAAQLLPRSVCLSLNAWPSICIWWPIASRSCCCPATSQVCLSVCLSVCPCVCQCMASASCITDFNSCMTTWTASSPMRSPVPTGAGLHAHTAARQG